MSILNKELSELSNVAQDSIRDLDMHNRITMSTKFQIAHIKGELDKIIRYREQLGRAIIQYQVKPDEEIKIPF